MHAAGDEFHLVHVIKDETEQLREYYQEKSLVRQYTRHCKFIKLPAHAFSLTGVTVVSLGVASSGMLGCCALDHHLQTISS